MILGLVWRPDSGGISRSGASRVPGLRRARSRGLSEVHVQHAATAAALNLGRPAAWSLGVPQVATRV